MRANTRNRTRWMHAKHELRYGTNKHYIWRKSDFEERVNGADEEEHTEHSDWTKRRNYAIFTNIQTSIEFCETHFGHAFTSSRYSHILMCERALNINKLPPPMFDILKLACLLHICYHVHVNTEHIHSNDNRKYVDFFARWISIANRMKCARICIWSMRS